MDTKIIENWNNVVKKNDNVYVVGDMFWCKMDRAIEILEELNGNKFLIKGNHDRCHDGRFLKKFVKVSEYMEIDDNGRKVVLCHYPIPFFRAGFAPTAFMLYGHVHQTIEYEYIAKLRREVKANATGYGTPNGNFINVGCMMPYMDYTPRTLDEIIEGDARYHEENPDAL